MTPTTTSTCPSCGGAVLPGDRFCGACGTAVSATGLAPTSPAGTVGSGRGMAGTPVTAVNMVSDASPWGVVATRLQAATLGEFEILSELGRGGMAAVYLARDLALNRRVAIKVMAPGLLLGPGMVERFRQEAVTVANLQHAHIVSIHAVRQLDDLHFFVMQFVPGRTLEGVLRDTGALPIDVARAWLYQVGSALGYAHRRGVIHRDIKPGNILLNADGEAIVTDFGIAKVAESPSHTQTGTVVGTPVYMSPEQCYARELTGASDQYSLGIVAYEMLAGRTPFSGSSFALMRAHTDEAPPPLREVRSDVPPTMEAALLRMLAKRPEERFATLGEALSSLGAAPLAPDDPLHGRLAALAAASARLEQLGDVLRTPASPVPKTRAAARPAGSDVVTPKTPIPTTQALVVAIAPPPSDLEPGARATLRVMVKTAAGQPADAADLRWSSSDPAIVVVDETTGAITALAPGRAVVAATADPAHDAVEVTVGEARAANVAITIPPGTFRTGDSLLISATVTSRFGVRVARPVEWSVNEATVAVIEDADAKGGAGTATLRAIGAGMVMVTASCDGAEGRATVRVVSAPPAAPPPVRAAGAAEHPRPGVTVPSATAVLAPSTPAAGPSGSALAPEGVPTSGSPAASGAVPASVAPNPAAPARPEPSAAPARRAPARSRLPILVWATPAVAAAAAVAYFAMQSPSDRAPAAGTGSRIDSAIVSGPGAATGTAPTSGDSTSTSTRSGTSGDSAGGARADSLTALQPPTPGSVSAAVPRRIDVRPPRPGPIVPGQTIALGASVRDGAGSVLRDARVTWSSSSPSVATVDAARGIVRGVGPGVARITARAGDATVALTVSVSPPAADPGAVVAVEMSEPRPLTVGESVRLSATARNGAGAPASGVVVEWSSSNPDVASVASSGTVTARAAGSATIRAAAGGRRTERTVTVRARDVAVRTDSPAAPPPAPGPPAAAVKTEAELRNEIQAVLATYARAIETRDTSLIRRVFPAAGSELLARWQGMFDDARNNIQMTGAGVELLDTPRDVAGSQVRARAHYTARFYSRLARAEQSVPITYTAVLNRGPGGWRIIGIR